MQTPILKGYCGYDKTLIPMHAARVKQQLNKKVNTGEFGTTTYKDFIILLLFKSFWLPMERKNYKDESEYLILDLLGNSNNGYKVNKTQYDFAVYVNQNFDDMDAVKEYEAKERQEEQEEFEREKRRQQEEEKRKEKEKAEILRWKRVIDDETISYIGTEAETKKNEIYSKIIKDIDFSFNIGPLILIAYANNINDVRARRELVSYLHTTNKASTKFFEWYAGVKLPKTNKARAEYILSLRSKDLNKQQIHPQYKYIPIPGNTFAIGVRVNYNGTIITLYRDEETGTVQAYGKNGQILSRGMYYPATLSGAIRQIRYLEEAGGDE